MDMVFPMFLCVCKSVRLRTGGWSFSSESRQKKESLLWAMYGQDY